MRQRNSNDSVNPQTFVDPQAFQVLEGQLTLEMAGETNKLIMGDLVFIPGNTTFSYWSDVRYTKMFVGAVGTGLDTKLISEAVPWDYAVFPNYF